MSFVNFIYEKENAITKDFCEKIIESGKQVIESGALTRHHQGKSQFPTRSFGRHDIQVFMPEDMPTHFGEIQDAVFDALKEYGEEINSVYNAILVCPVMKFQYTPLTGGYSVWHIEQGEGEASPRVLAWSIALNDVESGGETEFLYQGARYQPKAGSLLMWPAGVTHPHRGNPPISNDKFIVTGWLSYARSAVEAEGLKVLNKLQDNER